MTKLTKWKPDTEEQPKKDPLDLIEFTDFYNGKYGWTNTNFSPRDYNYVQHLGIYGSDDIFLVWDLDDIKPLIYRGHLNGAVIE